MADVDLFPTQVLNNDWFCQDGKDVIGASDGFEFLKELSPEQLLSNDPLDSTLLAQFSETSSLTSSPMGGFGFELPLSPQSDVLSSSGTDSSSEEEYSANGSQEEFTDFSSLLSSFQPQQILSPIPSTPAMSDDASNKKQKKRRKVQQSADSVQFYNGSGKFVELCEEDLIKLDSQKMECYIQAIHNERTLTATEDKELKRIRRLIKNREYAQSSRNKKKQHVEDMQSQVNAVKDENDKLQTRIQQLELENKNLKMQLGKIVQAVSADPVTFSKLKLDTTGLNLPAASEPVLASGPKRKRSAALFMVLFSFALLLSPSILPSSPLAGQPSIGNQVTLGGRTILNCDGLPYDGIIEMPYWTKAVSFLPDTFQDWIHRNYLPFEPDTCLADISQPCCALDNDSATNVKLETCDASLGCYQTKVEVTYAPEVNNTGL